MRSTLLVGLALLVLCFLALHSLPARLLPRFVDDQQLRLSGLSGTLLDGEAARAMLATPAGFLHLGRLTWNLDLPSLLSASPRVVVSSRWGGSA